MTKYRVMLECRNLLITMGDKVGKHGFFQTFFLEADSAADAEDAAIQAIRSNSDLRSVVRNPKCDSPTVHVKILEEIPEFPKDTRPVTGRVWYPEVGETEMSNRASEATAEGTSGADGSSPQG